MFLSKKCAVIATKISLLIDVHESVVTLQLPATAIARFPVVVYKLFNIVFDKVFLDKAFL